MARLSTDFSFDRDEIISREYLKYACVVNAPGTARVACPYPNTIVYEEDFDGTNRVKMFELDRPGQKTMTAQAGKIYYGTKNIFIHDIGSHHKIIPFSLSGLDFSVDTDREAPRQFYIYSLEDNTTVDYSDNQNLSASSSSLSISTAGTINTTITQQENNQYNHFKANKPILLSSQANSEKDSMVHPPAAKRIFSRGIGGVRTRTVHEGGRLALGGSTYDATNARSHYFAPNIGQVTEINDGEGSEGVQGASQNHLATTFAISQAIEAYSIISPYPDTKVDVYYITGEGGAGNISQWKHFETRTINGTIATPALMYNSPLGTTPQDQPGSSVLVGGTAKLWRFESTKPVMLVVDESTAGSELFVAGWGSGQLSPVYGANFKFKSKNSSWMGQGFTHHVSPLGINNMVCAMDLTFQAGQKNTRALVKKLQNATSGPKTGQAAFDGVGTDFNFGSNGESEIVINLDNDAYQNFHGSYVNDFSYVQLAPDLYETNIKLINNKVSSVSSTGMGFVSKDKLIDSAASTKVKHDIFYVNKPGHSNTNVFDNYYYMNNDRNGSNFSFDGTAEQLSGLTTYTGDYVNATRVFYFQPDRQVQIAVDHSYREVAVKGSFMQQLNISRNQNYLGQVRLTFNNRTNKEAYAILHFLETHLGYKSFVFYNTDGVTNENRVYYCDEWSHNYIYFDSNTITATFTEIANPITPNF